VLVAPFCSTLGRLSPDVTCKKVFAVLCAVVEVEKQVFAVMYGRVVMEEKIYSLFCVPVLSWIHSVDC
jgi:hypothetical protein